MSYAIRKDNQGWRSIDNPLEIEADEYYSEEKPDSQFFDKSLQVRNERDILLSTIYDKRTMICQREIRMTVDAKRLAILNLEQKQLDLYAKALQAIPEQSGFPDIVEWPEIPSTSI